MPSDDDDDEIIIIRRISVPRRKLLADEQATLRDIEMSTPPDEPLSWLDRWRVQLILGRAASRP